ncbi:hypothetical protein IFM89_025950, partial [Coptis chinensis]
MNLSSDILKGCTETLDMIIHNDEWRIPEELQFLLDEHGIDIHSLEKPNSSEVDERVWTHELRGNFTVKSAFGEIRSTLATTCWSRIVWKKSIHPQLSAIAWKLVHKCTTTQESVEATFASFTEAINVGTCLSPRLRDLWLSAVLGGAVSLWKHRNKVFHEDLQSNL